jgi:CarD family transcriptional regulator
MYGAGIIEGIENKAIDGIEKSYYTLYVPINNLKVQISADNPKNINMRKVIDYNEILTIFENSDFEPFHISENWSQRCDENKLRLRSGDISEVSSVYKYLYNKEQIKALSTIEKKMMYTSKQMLIGEITLSSGMTTEDAENILKNKLKKI